MEIYQQLRNLEIGSMEKHSKKSQEAQTNPFTIVVKTGIDE
jgi:hypothetical protein